jgi:photosystem II stability/assembly factor-like uncharacterized protein
MKNILKIILFGILNFVCLQAQWEQCNNGLFGYEPDCIAFKDSKIFVGSYSGGVLYSTDYGKQWQLTNKPDSTEFKVISLAVTGKYIYAGLYGVFNHEGGIYFSSDNGNNWINTGFDLNYPHVYSLVVKDTMIFASTINGLFRTNIGDNQWTLLKDSNVYSFIVQDNTIYIAALNGIFSSTDNGDTWINKSIGFENTYFLSLAANDKYIFAGNYDGIFRSNDKGLNWAKTSFEFPINMEQLKSNGSSIYASSYDGFFISRDNGLTWHSITTGLNKKNIISCAVNNDTIYASSVDGNLIYSSDDCLTWKGNKTGLNIGTIHTLESSENTLLATENYNGLYISTDNGNNWNIKLSIVWGERINSLAIDSSKIYAGTSMVYDEKASLFYSADFGTSWKDINIFNDIRAISNVTLLENKLFAYHEAKGLLITTDNGESWSKVFNDDSDIHDYFNGLVVSIDNIYVATGHGLMISNDKGINWIDHTFDKENNFVSKIGARGCNVCVFVAQLGFYISTDNGINWKIKNWEFEKPLINSIEVFGNHIFVASDKGIYISTFDSDNWLKVNEGFPTVCLKLSVNKDYIFGNTEGRGLYRSKLSNFGITAVIEQIHTAINDILIFPNPASDYIYIQPSEGWQPSEGYDIQIFDMLGINLSPAGLGIKGGGKIDISNLSLGIYFIKIGNHVEKFVKM